MGFSKVSFVFYFGLLVAFHECAQDFYFDDATVATSKLGLKEESKQFLIRQVASSSDDADLVNDASGDVGSGDGSGDGELVLSTSSSDPVQSTVQTERIETTTGEFSTTIDQEEKFTISSNAASTDESGDGSTDFEGLEPSESPDGSEETRVPDVTPSRETRTTEDVSTKPDQGEKTTAIVDGSDDENTVVGLPVSESPTKDAHSPFLASESSREIATESSTTEMSLSYSSSDDPLNTQSTSEKSQPNRKNGQFVKIRVCMLDFVCTAETRGPCSASETLVVEDGVDNSSLTSNKNFGMSCSALSCYPWKNCFKAKRLGNALPDLPLGKCVPNAHANVCSCHPANYRYNEEKQLYRPNSRMAKRKPHGCGPDKIFIGFPYFFGWCECLHHRYLPYIGDNSCYKPFTRGPCQHDQWLVPSKNRTMSCQRCPCPNKADGNHIYWPGDSVGEPGCYRPYTAGPCPDGSVFIVSDYVAGKAHCSLPNIKA